MISRLKLLPGQWKLLASAFSNMSQAIILFSLAAIFVPETVQLNIGYPKVIGIVIFVFGLMLLVASVIIVKKGEKRNERTS